MNGREGIRTNARGLRADRDYAPEPAPDRRRIALYRPREIGGHFSVEGHRLVAKLVTSHLRAQGWLDRGH